MHNQIADYLSTKSIEAVREKVCKAKNILIGLDILEMLLKQSGAGSDSFMMEFLLIGTEESPLARHFFIKEELSNLIEA